MSTELLAFNGINGATGDYGLPPMTGDELARFIQGEAPPENLAELRYRHRSSAQGYLGVKEGVDPKRLDEAGWGVIFAYDADPAIKEALSALLDLRSGQAGEHFRIYERSDAYRPGENKSKFLARHGAGPGPADPEKVPYYLLIVGSPEDIPYQFQYQLDVQYAVGRLHLDTLQDYDNYARSVVEVERGAVKLPRRAAFFSVANPEDRATNSTTKLLIEPLYDQLKSTQSGWEIAAFLRDQATKAQLGRLLGGDQTPALLFTGSHGMEFPLDSPRQLPHQGALLCQDWPGPGAWRGAIPEDFYFSGDDLAGDAGLLGLLAFYFACYGAGTPLSDEFSKQAFRERQAIAPHPFVARLPTRMLGHPRGGALAVIGHVERAWSYSFDWPGAGAQTTVFQSTLERLLDGHPVGSAIEYFNERYAELASDLSVELEEIEYGKQVDPYELAGMWTANNDARSYVIIGDPAVRLPVAKPDEVPEERPVIVLRHVEDVSTVPPRAEPEVLVVPQVPVEEAVPPPSEEAEPLGVSLGLPAAAPFGLAALLPASGDDLESLTVSTYAAADMSDPEAGDLKARTQLSLAGDVETMLPAELTAEDKPYLDLHQATVREALEARIAYLKLLAQIAAGQRTRDQGD